MSVQAGARFDVGLDAFVAAVKATMPHVGKAQKDTDALSRVRLIAERRELYVVATNGATSAMSVVKIDDGTDSRDDRTAVDDGVFVLDVDPSELANVPQRFIIGRAGRKSTARRVLRLDFTSNRLHITDVTEHAGTLDLESADLDDVAARELGLVLLEPHVEFPDVVRRIREAAAGVGEAVESKPLVAEWSTVHLFDAAGKAFRQPLEFAATGPATSRGFVVTCSKWFVGTVSSKHNDDDSLGKRRRSWLEHLHRLTGKPLPPNFEHEGDDDVPPQDDDGDVTSDGLERGPGEDADGFYDPDRDPAALQLDETPSPAADEPAAGRLAFLAPVPDAEG